MKFLTVNYLKCKTLPWNLDTDRLLRKKVLSFGNVFSVEKMRFLSMVRRFNMDESVWFV